MKKTSRSIRSSIIDRPVLISGIQPTGRLHLGNYLGALKNFVDLQNFGKYQCYFFIADYHSLTEDFDPKKKSEEIANFAADYLAAGLDPKKSTIFLQSQVPQSTELAWILSTITPFGELSRMTQFKEKSANVQHPTSNNVGLFTYPILMSADILLYDTQVVPVGEDQLQHLELVRTLARKFNSKFGQTFIEPRALMTTVPRLMSLDDPTKKMSKSRPAGCLFIDDEPKIIDQKIRAAVTDSGSEVKYDPEKKPAISNLMMIYAELAPSGGHSEPIRQAQDKLREESLRAIEKKFAGKGYADFKKSLAKVVSDYFADFRKKKSSLLGSSLRAEGEAISRNDEKLSLREAQRRGNLSVITSPPSVIAIPQKREKQSYKKLVRILNSGSKKARKIASKKLAEIKERIGLAL